MLRYGGDKSRGDRGDRKRHGPKAAESGSSSKAIYREAAENSARDPFEGFDSDFDGFDNDSPFKRRTSFGSNDSANSDTNRMQIEGPRTDISEIMWDAEETWRQYGCPGGELALAGLYRHIEECGGRYEWKPGSQEEADREGVFFASEETRYQNRNNKKRDNRERNNKVHHDQITQARVKEEKKSKSSRRWIFQK